MISKLRAAGLTLQASATAPRAAGPQTLDGLTFVITGTLSLPRDEVRSWIESLGGKVSGSVTSKTDYLVIGGDPGGTKYNRAQALGTPMLTEDQLVDLAGVPLS